MYVLDTNIVSEFTKPRPNFETISWAQDYEGELYLTSVTIMELNYGIMRLDEGKRKQSLKAHIEAIVHDCSDNILDFDSFSAYLCAQLRRQAHAAGRVPQIADLMIAAICERHGATLVTHNVKDFDYLGIELVDPFDYESPVLAELRHREASRQRDEP